MNARLIALVALTGVLTLAGCGAEGTTVTPTLTSDAAASASSPAAAGRGGAGRSSDLASGSGTRPQSAGASGYASPTAGVQARGAGADARIVTGTPRAAATRIAIPAIGLDHQIVAGGLRGGVLNPTPGSIQQLIGFGRVAPGRAGISVLAGHVTYEGPDVFYALHQTPVGGTVTISYADGTTKNFVVTNKESVSKDALQRDARVWGSSATPVVVLVTCDASSGWVNAQHHANNFVVWARPA